MPENSGWDIIFNEWKLCLYSDIVSLIGIIVALVAAIRYWRNHYLHYLFFIYILSTLCVVIILPICGAVIFKSLFNSRTILNEYANIVFLMVEFGTLFAFFLELYKKKIPKRVFVLTLIFFSISIVFLLIKAFYSSYELQELKHLVNLVFSLELLFFGGLCIYYFYDFVRDSGSKDLFGRPSFWIVAGMFLYCLAIVPFLIIAGIIESTHQSIYIILYTVHYVSLAVFFLTIARAFAFRLYLTD